MTEHRPNLLITGASGLLGTELLQRFAANGRPAAGLYRRPAPGGAPGKAIVVPDIFRADWAEEIAPDAALLHCAGLSNPRQQFSGPAEVMERHVLPHLRMVETLLERGWRGRLLLPSSGGAIYGDTDILPIPETHPLNPKSLYGLQKLLIEKSLGEMARRHGFQLVALRISNPYGSFQPKANQGVVPLLIAAFRARAVFPVFGDGSALRDYIHFDDLFRAVDAACRMPPGAPVLELNIGSGTGTSLNALIARLSEMFGYRLECEYTPSPLDVSSSVLDCSRARDVLNWQARISIEEGLSRMVERP